MRSPNMAPSWPKKRPIGFVTPKQARKHRPLRAKQRGLGLCGIAAGVADGEAGSAEHEPEAHDVPEAERVTCRLEQRIADREQRRGRAERQEQEERPGQLR